MQKQRERMEARRKRLKEEVEKVKAKKVKKAVTRDTSKDQSRKTVNRLTGGTTPKTGESAKQTLSKFASKKPAPAAKPVVKAKPAKSVKPVNKNGSVKATRRKTSYEKEVERRNKIDKGWSNRTGAEDQARSEKNEVQLNIPKNPKPGSKYKHPRTGAMFYYDGSKWVRGRLGKTTRFKR